MSGIYAILPLKRFQQAKRRLKDVLTPAQREVFFRAMVEDVLAALAGSEQLAGTLVVSADATTRELANAYGADWIAEGDQRGLNGALEHGARHLLAIGADGALIVPGDVPLITSAEVDRLVSIHRAAPAMTVVPAEGDGGTNALIVSPPTLVRFQYGKGSCRAHLASGRAAGVTPQIIEDSPGFRIDIDRPDELASLMDSEASGRAIDYLRLALRDAT